MAISFVCTDFDAKMVAAIGRCARNGVDVSVYPATIFRGLPELVFLQDGKPKEIDSGTEYLTARRRFTGMDSGINAGLSC